MNQSMTLCDVCPHCYPERAHHRQDKLNSFINAYISRPCALVWNLLTFNQLANFTYNYLITTIKVLRKFNKIEQHDTINDAQTSMRLRLLWEEARKRGLELYSFSLNKQQLLSFLLIYKGKNYYFHYTPTTLLHVYSKQYQDPVLYDDKYYFKNTLIKNNLPYAPGKVFFSAKAALSYGLKLGFPLVVKPASSTFSHHISLNIQDVDSLKRGIEVAKMIDCRVIVERFIEGDAHRMMVVGDQFIVCSKRTRPEIIGDGHSSIDSLIKKFNANPLRGEVGQEGYSLFQIEKSPIVVAYLQNQGLDFNSVLQQGRAIYLSDKSNCSSGAEVIDKTQEVCSENIKLFIQLQHAMGIGVSAVDFICQDVSKPWHKQSFAFLENNSFPAFDPQHNPSQGKSIDVAKEIWDLVLEGIG